MFSSHNETATLIDAIESLRVLRQKSRNISNGIVEYRADDNQDVKSNIKDFKKNQCDAMEHRRKIRELIIAIEEQELDEARRAALESPRAAEQAEISEKQSTKKHEYSGATVIESPSSAQVNAPLHCIELKTLDEQRRKIDSLARDFDAKLNVAMKAQALPGKTDQITMSLAAQVENILCSTGEHDVPFSGCLVEKESARPKSVVSPDILQSVKTLSTELDTLDADSMRREQNLTSNQGNVISSLVNKEDFENEETSFGAPVSPDSFFVKYGIYSSQPYRSTLCVSQCVIKSSEKLSPVPQKSKRERQKAVIKNAAILSESAKEAMRAAASIKSNRPIEMFKKMIVWDVSSSSSQEESIPEGRVYNATFDDSSCHGEERSDLSSSYSSSFETDAENGKEKRTRKKHPMSHYRSSYDSEDSAALHPSYSGSADEKTDGSTSDIEYQTSYTSTDGYDTISYVSSSTTLLGREGFPLL